MITLYLLNLIIKNGGNVANLVVLIAFVLMPKDSLYTLSMVSSLKSFPRQASKGTFKKAIYKLNIKHN